MTDQDLTTRLIALATTIETECVEHGHDADCTSHLHVALLREAAARLGVLAADIIGCEQTMLRQTEAFDAENNTLEARIVDLEAELTRVREAATERIVYLKALCKDFGDPLCGM